MNITKNFEAPFGHYPCLRLETVARWGIISTTKKQSVAEHCFLVSRILMVMMDKGIIDVDIEKRGELIEEALTHDDDEVYTGDIPTPAKIKKDGDTKTSWQVKLADLIEARRFIAKYCNDTIRVNRWVLVGLDNSINKILDEKRIPYTEISFLLGEGYL